MFLDAGKSSSIALAAVALARLLRLSLDVVIPLVIWDGHYGERIERTCGLPNERARYERV
jgi:hypothetical protein